MDMPDPRSRSNTLTSTPSLKTGHDGARHQFWLAMLGFVMALALLPFSYKVERHLETAVRIESKKSKKLMWNWRSVSSRRTLTAWFWWWQRSSRSGFSKRRRCIELLTRSLRSMPVRDRMKPGLAGSTLHREQRRGVDHHRIGPARRNSRR